VKATAASDPARFPLLLLDTHALVWLMFGERRLGKQAHEAIRKSSRVERLLVSAITPWEIGVLVAKGRIDLHQDTMGWVRTALALPGVKLSPLEPEIAVESTRLPWEMHADPADRILVATARHLGATLVTADGVLLGMARQGHFVGMDAGA
jgi:PIN domain nuclease of toxin-antitoxin system